MNSSKFMPTTGDRGGHVQDYISAMLVVGGASRYNDAGNREKRIDSPTTGGHFDRVRLQFAPTPVVDNATPVAEGNRPKGSVKPTTPHRPTVDQVETLLEWVRGFRIKQGRTCIPEKRS